MEPIRILHVGLCENYYGTEKLIMDLYRHLDRSRFQFDFLMDHLVGKVKYETEIEELGGHIYRNFYRIKERYSRGYISLHEFVNRHPEINGGIHFNVNFYTISDLSVFLAANQGHFPIRIVHSHNSGADGMGRRSIVSAKHALIRSFSHLFCNKALACSDLAVKWAFGNRQAEIIPNGVETAQYAFSREERRNMRQKEQLCDKLVLGFVGRLSPQKNPEFLIDILEAVNKHIDNAELIIIGEGELRDRMASRAKAKGINNLRFVGYADNVREWLQAFDVFLLPSRHEGLGLVLIEAQASGLRCIASDAVPLEAAVTDRLAFLSLESPEKWAQAIFQVPYDYERHNGAREVRTAGYDIQRSANRLMEIYDELLHKLKK